MSTNENLATVDQKGCYETPEMVHMGGVLELTAGSPDEVLSDGCLKPNGYKGIDIRPAATPVE